MESDREIQRYIGIAKYAFQKVLIGKLCEGWGVLNCYVISTLIYGNVLTDEEKQKYGFTDECLEYHGRTWKF